MNRAGLPFGALWLADGGRFDESRATRREFRWVRGSRFLSLFPSSEGSLRGVPEARRSVVSGNIFNSSGVLVGIVVGPEIFDPAGRKLYDLKGVNIYRPSGELVGHLGDTRGSEKRLDRSTDRLFPTSNT